MGEAVFRVLFVCTGNICRSPTAEGVFRALVRKAGLDGRIVTDSAGIGDWHVGSAPDRRATAAARRRGVDLSDLRARQVARLDFDRFDLILAMDRSHLADLRRLCPTDKAGAVRLFMDFAGEGQRPGSREVPDPYYGGPDGFEEVLDMVEAGARGLLDHIIRTSRRDDGTPAGTTAP